MRQGSIRAATLFLAGALVGCATAPEPTSPSLDVPATWRFAPSAQGTWSDSVDSHWSRGFGSAALDDLVAQALAKNDEVTAADARLSQARAALADARGALFPQLSVQASHTGPNAALNSSDAYLASGAYSWLLNGAYDLDIWGVDRDAVDAARANAQAQRYALDSVKLDLAAAVMSTFVQTSAMQARVEVASRNLEVAERTEALVATRVENGYIPRLELFEQRTLVATQTRTVASLRQQAAASEIALAELLGVAPANFAPMIDEFGRLSIPTLAPALPSVLLTRRPDIAQAEARLATADANVRAARAALLPSVNISAALYDPGSSLARIAASPFYALSASVAATIFDGGHLRARRDLAQAQRAELIAGYQRAVSKAFCDVEAALNAIAGTDSQLAAQRSAIEQAQAALATAQARYAAGGETLLTVLDAERSLFSEQDLAVQLRLANMLAKIALFKAMGGGWQDDAVTVPYAPARAG
ncbi:efflux transporter outer membrane subunit [Paraburkholderia caledonica]|uniref:NodT family efflux transporter outer membrane factor (OMF) lipoprotein n=1 Tax=Paraburkholderia caledonica TaxID=134536 RepID=A0AB73IIB6_9BURK|nr:NodT family efflux transporter outer membrane factor (OMF) lipoprotein [Paraburkholderia caledonica]